MVSLTKTKFFTPVIATMLRDRRLTVFVAVGLAVQVAAGLLHAPGMPCPMLGALGIPCPGCGGTRATVCLIHGDLRQMAALHLYAPVFLAAVALFVGAAVLPARLRHRMIDSVERTERRTGITAFLVITVLLYWIARLAYDAPAFVEIVSR